MRVVGYTSATYTSNGRLLRATYNPDEYCLLNTRAACRKCKAQPGRPCVTPRGWGTRTHAIRIGDTLKMRREDQA